MYSEGGFEEVFRKLWWILKEVWTKFEGIWKGVSSDESSCSRTGPHPQCGPWEKHPSSRLPHHRKPISLLPKPSHAVKPTKSPSPTKFAHPRFFPHISRNSIDLPNTSIVRTCERWPNCLILMTTTVCSSFIRVAVTVCQTYRIHGYLTQKSTKSLPLILPAGACEFDALITNGLGNSFGQETLPPTISRPVRQM